MNQDMVVENLLKLDDTVEEFTVLFSGKSSKKIDGLYKPEEKNILIHNKNFPDDNALMYTAIHEFAHHIQFTTSDRPVSARAHTVRFWDIFHKLLYNAEEKGIYVNIFKSNKTFIDLSRKIKENFLSANGELMKEFGKLLIEAYNLCQQHHLSFEDYVDRELQLHRTTAKTIMKINSMDLNPKIGFENMKTVANLKDQDDRQMAEEAFLEGKSPDMVKAQFSHGDADEDDMLERLLARKEQIERNLERLTLELAQIERQIGESRG